MNVLFHTTTAIGITALLTDTHKLGNNPTLNKVAPTALANFVIGVISHGALDFIPHCYPVNSKLDVVISLGIILFVSWRAKGTYSAVVAASFFGCIFPDLVDLGPKLLNKYLSLGMTLPENFFPWHWHEYSGSIYTNSCDVSTINHILVIVTVGIILWARKTDLAKIFSR